MAGPKSAKFRQVAGALSSDELPLQLIEVSHALLTEPMRRVNDTQDVVSNGKNYVAGSFAFVPPDDEKQRTPRASLTISNQRGDVGAIFERLHGGRGAVITVRQIMRSNPDFLEDELVLDLSNVEVTAMSVSGQLSYDDILNKVGTPATYRPETAPGLF